MHIDIPFQIHSAAQQRGFVRVKRGMRRAIPSSAFAGTAPVSSLTAYAQPEDTSNQPTDPYFPLQWYLRNTGQNGGKVRLDLNVQAAWDQGITGKNVTTAIMDDGKCVISLRNSTSSSWWSINVVLACRTGKLEQYDMQSGCVKCTQAYTTYISYSVHFI